MKRPNLFFKFWDNSETEADMPKLGIDWWTRKGSRFSPWAGAGMYLIFFGCRLDISFANDSKAYIKDMEDATGLALIPYRIKKQA